MISVGEVNEAELDVATRTEEVTTSTNFTCGTHFYEEVEDTKDSVWVVQVRGQRSNLRSDWVISRYGPSIC